MKISELDNIVSTYQFYASRRSYFLEAANHCTYSTDFSILVDDHKFHLNSDDPSFIRIGFQHILYSLAYDSDSQLLSFCKDHDIDYEPISDDKYSIWFSAKFQSK